MGSDAGLNDYCELRGIIADNYLCIDCGMDTWPGQPTRAEVERSLCAGAGLRLTFTMETEIYYVHPHVCPTACLCVRRASFQFRSSFGTQF
jgi:hypothetical protein